MAETQIKLDTFKQASFPKRDVLKKVERLTYSQDWSSYNSAKTQEKIIAEKLLLELLESIEIKTPIHCGRKGAPIPDRIFSMFVYNYSGYSSRRCISDLKIAKQRNLIENVPHFNSILNYFGNSNLTTILARLIHITSLPLRNIESDFAVDSSGFSTSLFEQWLNVRTQRVEKKRRWKKCHVIIGTKTNVITSVRITEGSSADSPELMPLATTTAQFFDMEELSADKAYLSRDNLTGIAELGAIPYIPFKSNSTRNPKGSIIWSRMYDYFLNNRETFDNSYHKRSNVETTFHMIKRNFGNSLRTKCNTSQTNEILMKCLCHNLAVLVQESFELGLDINFLNCAKIALAQVQVI